MKNHIKQVIAAVLLLLIVAALPIIFRAEEQTAEQKPQQKQVRQPVEQKPDEDKVTGEMDLSALSAYIWRDYQQTRAGVVSEPSVTIGNKGFPHSDDARYKMKAHGLEGVDPTERNSTYLYGGVTLSCTF